MKRMYTCVVCNRVFKYGRSYKVHMESKAHQKAAETALAAKAVATKVKEIVAEQTTVV